MKGDEFGFARLINNIQGRDTMKETDRLEELRIKIIQWADEKGILKNATTEKQFLKFIEETGELAKAILNNDSEEFIDAVGDVFVTIVIHAELSGYKIKINYINTPDQFLAQKIMSMIDCVRPLSYNYAISHLIDIRREFKELTKGKTFSDCVQIAYDVISKRTGSMVNGTFVKDK